MSLFTLLMSFVCLFDSVSDINLSWAVLQVPSQQRGLEFWLIGLQISYKSWLKDALLGDMRVIWLGGYKKTMLETNLNLLELT